MGWVSLLAAGKPTAVPKRQVFEMAQTDGSLGGDFDTDLWKTADALVVCPTDKPWNGQSKTCVHFSLKGFAAALAYVCDAKSPS